LGVMGTALGLGIQAHNVCATVKHYALNSMENARFKVDVQIDERALHEVYLPHFKMALDAGIASVMSAYNKMNGEYAGQNRELLTDILRGEWGFDGFVHSDWVMGVYKPYGAAAGLDVENPEPLVFGEKLKKAVEDGQIEPQVIDQACRRILRVYYRFACADDPLPVYGMELVAQASHVALALEAAEKSAVLLSNDGVLPLDRTKTSKIAVLGRLADMENTGDNGSSRVRPPYVVTPLGGLRTMLGDDAVLVGDESDLAAAKANASAADAVIVIVGNTAKEEGEYIPGDIALGQVDTPSQKVAIGGDRDHLGLPADQLALIDAAVASGKPVVVVIVAGSAIMVEGWHDRVGAILQTFYSGMEGGTALAKILFGDVSPSAKLPFTVATDLAHYPHFDKDADSIIYDQWHGYAKFEREQRAARFAFGHGLSYSNFAYRALSARVDQGELRAFVAVTNTGSREATEVVQLYVAVPGLVAERHLKSLQAFERVSIAPSETKVVRFTVPLDRLRWRDPEAHDWKLEHGTYRVLAGGASDHLLETTVRI
jgi:beta-glucosidase